MFRTTTTVTAPAGTHDLVSLANLKVDIGITDSSDDAFLTRAISIVSAKIEQYCNRTFAVETVSDLIDVEVDPYPHQFPTAILALQTSRFPIISVTSVTEGGTALVAGTDFRTDADNGRIYRLNAAGDVRPWAATPIVVVYSSGFATVPLDLQSACGDVVRSVKFNKTRDPLLRSENILSGLYAYTLFDPSQIPSGQADQVAAVLSNYRVPVTA